MAEKAFDELPSDIDENTPPPVRYRYMAHEHYLMLDQLEQEWEDESKIRAAEAQADDLPRVKFETSKGDIVLELFENEAPQATANMITLVKQGYYDGLAFHRVLPHFMAQGGDNGSGPGYTIRCECYQPNYRKHFRGTLSMAKTQARDSGSAQFFLCFVPTKHLDGKHTAFGRVIEGIELLGDLQKIDPSQPGPYPEPDKILKATVLRDRGHEYEFEKLPGPG
jgi:cyclophilin family peptidyl-prolyl cis-trans isomerase